MTPQLRTQPGLADSAPGESHLTGEQFGELMAGTTEAAGGESTSAEAHLKACEQCAAELASLREAITLFREASNAYAERRAAAQAAMDPSGAAFCSRSLLCRRTGSPPRPCF